MSNTPHATYLQDEVLGLLLRELINIVWQVKRVAADGLINDIMEGSHVGVLQGLLY